MRRPIRLARWFRLLVLFNLALSSLGASAPAFAQSLGGIGGGAPPIVNAGPHAVGTPTGAPAMANSPAIKLDSNAEVASRRTQSSRTYRTDHGALITVVSPGSLNFQDAQGHYQPIDNTLVPDSTSGFAYTNQANRYQVHLPKTLAAGPVRVSEGAAFVQFALQGAVPSAAVRATKNAASYANVLPGVSVSYAAGNDRLQEDLTLQNAAAPHSFTYTLQTQGLTEKADGQGGIAFLDSMGNLVFRFAPPSVQDSAKQPAAAVASAASLTLGSRAGSQTVTLSVDPAWLAAPQRVYPVTIDPTVLINPWIGTNPTPNCYIQSGSGSSGDFCNPANLYVGYDGSSVYRSLMQFGVSAISPDSTVLNAFVSWSLNPNAGQPAQAVPVEVRQVSHPWTTGVTWNTEDGVTAWTTPGGDYTATPLDTESVDPNAPPCCTLFSVTQDVQGWVNHTVANDGLLFKAANESAVGLLTMNSMAACCNLPVLEVEWEPALGQRPFYPMLSFGQTDRSGLQVNVATGNLVIANQDLAIAGTGIGLTVDRWYNSVPGSIWDMGPGWTASDGNTDELHVNETDGVSYYASSGYAAHFFNNGSGGYVSPPGLDALLVKNSDGSYTLTFQHTGLREQFAAPSDGANARLEAFEDTNGNAIRYARNPDGTVSTITDSQGRITTLGYTSWGGLKTVTDSTGRVAHYGYDAGDNLTSYTDANGKVTQYSYGQNGLVITITDPLGQQTYIPLNSQHQVSSLTMANGTAQQATWSFSYGAGMTTVTDPNQHQTTYAYDSLYRLTKTTDALGNSFQTSWTADDQPATTTDAYGKVTTYGYDANNNPNRVTLPTGATTSAVYGTVANIPSYYVPTSSTDAQGNTTTYGYDGNGNVTTITDALPSQNVTRLYYNANGTVDHVVDARGDTTSYGYDAKGNLTKITPPAPMGATTIVPDALSRVSSVTDGKGQQRTYTYDNLDRLTQLAYPAYGAGNVAWQYDADGNLSTMVDSTGTTDYQYDAQNRQTKKTLPSSLGGGSFGYGYDAAGNLTGFSDSASVPGQTLSVTYGYDAADEVTSLAEGGKTTSFGYDANHNRTSTTYPDGVVMAQGYDANQRLTSIVGSSGSTTLSSFSYSYAKGTTDTLLPQSYQETLAAPGSGPTAQVNGTMTYDPANRLTKWLVTKQGAPSTVVHDYTYQYDGTGNRTQVVADPLNAQGQIVADPSQGTAHSNESDLAFNAPGELATIQPYGGQGQAGQVVTYSYDTAGNQLGNDGGGTGKPLTIAYLPTNQTQSISDLNQNAETMAWAGAGQAERVKRTWSDQGTSYSATYTWSLLGMSGYTNNGIAEPTKTTSVTSWIVRDPSGTPVAQRYSNGQEEYYLFDGQGDVVGLEDPGVMQAAYDYCPTGNEADLASTQMTAVGLANPLRQGAVPYDDLTKDYFGFGGIITEDYSGIGTQRPGLRYGDVVIPTYMPNAGGGGEACDTNSNPEETTADEEGCDVSQNTTGESSASAGGGGGSGYSPWPGPGNGRQVIGGRTYSQHALDRMVPKGLSFKGNHLASRGIPPSVVENALQNGQRVAQGAGDAVKYVYDNVTVIYNEVENRVVTLWATGR